MRRERDWGRISEITDKRGVCIGPRGGNYERAKRDFERGGVRYYSFPLETGNARGYIRFFEVKDGLLLDFVSPYGNERSVEALTSFIHKAKKVVKIYVPQGNLPDGACKAEKQVITEDYPLSETTGDYEQRVYGVGKKSVIVFEEGE